jgi:Ser/Thr protein kinase RdoA (MazF antagonist)
MTKAHHSNTPDDRFGADSLLKAVVRIFKPETSQVYTDFSIKLLQDVHARTHPASQAATSPVEIPCTD